MVDVINEKQKQYYQQYYGKNKDARYEYHKQYNEQNKDVIRENKKQYYEQNKDALLEKKKQKYEQNKAVLNQKTKCECGCVVVKRTLNQHKQSKKHIKLMEKVI